MTLGQCVCPMKHSVLFASNCVLCFKLELTQYQIFNNQNIMVIPVKVFLFNISKIVKFYFYSLVYFVFSLF